MESIWFRVRLTYPRRLRFVGFGIQCLLRRFLPIVLQEMIEKDM